MSTANEFETFELRLWLPTACLKWYNVSEIRANQSQEILSH